MMSLLLSDLLSTDLHSTELDINLGVIFFLLTNDQTLNIHYERLQKNLMLTDVWTEKETQIVSRVAPGTNYVT
jgi:hypothetical protein